MFSVRTRPFKGEALSSFLLRFSESNGIGVLTLWNTFKKDPTFYPKKTDIVNLDSYPPITFDSDGFINLFKNMKPDICELTFYYAFNKFCNGSSIPDARFMKGLIRNILHFCPLCLADKSFLRLKWRVCGIDYCTKHNCKLNQSCIGCDREIYWEDLTKVGLCPYCNQKLSNQKYEKITNNEDWVIEQTWIDQAWTYLLSPTNDSLTSKMAAKTLLFVLNDFGDIYKKAVVEKNFAPFGRVQNLLQYARGTWKSNRVIHLDVLLRVLLGLKCPIDKYFSLKLPERFILSVDSPSREKIILREGCQSPWCPGYLKTDCLIKLSSSTIQTMTGTDRKSHYACLECGCEIIIVHSGDVFPKGYFHTGFLKINEIGSTSITNTRLSQAMNIDRRIARRILAYFITRPMKGIQIPCPFEIMTELLERFLSAVQSRTVQNEIMKWPCWQNFDHYLLYRYHPIIMKEMILQKRSAKLRKNISYDNVAMLCESMIAINEAITIERVGERIGISSNTLRKRGIVESINQLRKKQQLIYKQKKIELLKEKVDTFFKENFYEKILSKDIYRFLGVRQSYLCTYSPELNRYIESKRHSY